MIFSANWEGKPHFAKNHSQLINGWKKRLPHQPCKFPNFIAGHGGRGQIRLLQMLGPNESNCGAHWHCFSFPKTRVRAGSRHARWSTVTNQQKSATRFLRASHEDAAWNYRELQKYLCGFKPSAMFLLFSLQGYLRNTLPAERAAEERNM